MLGVDRAVGYMVLARAWSLFGGPVSLLLVAKCLTAKEQGFFYTIGSLLSMQLLFELGLMQIITHVTAHEMHSITLTEDFQFVGDQHYVGRIGCLLRESVRWFACAGILMILLCASFGLMWLGARSESATVAWKLPWLLAVIMTAIGLVSIPLVALLSGLGFVAEVAKATVHRAILNNLASWSVLILGGSLLAVPIQLLVGILGGPVLLIWRFRRVFTYLWAAGRNDNSFDWKRDVWPLQWRAAASWISSWFVFQLFTPVVFRFQGAEEAGRIGMALNIATQYSAVIRSWIETRSPRWGRLIAQGKKAKVFGLFRQILFVSTMIYLFGAMTVTLIVTFALPVFWPSLSHRLLNPFSFFVMFIAFGITHLINGFQICIRAFKAEPFLRMALVNGALAMIGMFTLGRWFGIPGVLTTLLLVQTIVILPWTYFIFNSFRSGVLSPQPAR